MTQNQFKILLKSCRVIGIETLADLARFNKEERNKGETLPQALARYAEEIKNK